VVLRNTIVSGGCAGQIKDGVHNIDDGITCGFLGAACTIRGGTSFCNTNPQLDPAGLNSDGGLTQTIALEPGSPAVDAGGETLCKNVDQRGFVRPGAGHAYCSIGAYEADAAAPAACVGDCGGTHTVGVNDVITLVNIALGNDQPAACLHGLPDGAAVDVALIIRAVSSVLYGCSG
jgi:hypothetical protein